MNIGVDIRPLMAPYRTGVGEYTFELLNALFAIDTVNQYVLFYNSSADVTSYLPTWKQDNVHMVATRWSNKMLNASLALSGWPTLDRVIMRKVCPPVVSLDYWFSPNLNFTAVSAATKRILTIHDLSYEFFPDCFSPKDRLWHEAVRPRWQVQHAEIILTPSAHTKRDVVDYYGIDEKNVHVLYPGIAPKFTEGNQDSTLVSRVRARYQLPKNYILSVSTLEPRKNILALIDAYRQSSLQARGFSLIIAGSRGWQSDDVMQAIRSTRGCQYIGYVAPEDKVSLYQNASLFLYPSLYEGFGFPVVEAMSCGVPVITSNRSSLPEVCADAAILVNPLNTSEIARAMSVVLSTPAIAEQMRQRGVHQAAQYSWPEAARQFLQLLTA